MSGVYKMDEKKRTRVNGVFRWTELQTKELLTCVLESVKSNPEHFEKPTAQRFYERITATSPNIYSIKWNIMRTKMRHLKTNFMSALKWQGQTGAGLLESGDGASVEQYVKKICPFFDDLQGIFGQRVNIQPPVIYQSSEPVSLLANNENEILYEEYIECSASVNSELCIPTQSPPTSPSVILSCTQPQSTENSTVSPSTNTCTQQKNATPQRILKRPHQQSPFALLFEIQKQKVEIEAQKLQLEKEKEENKFKLQKLQLEKEERIEMEKLRLENERLKNLQE